MVFVRRVASSIALGVMLLSSTAFGDDDTKKECVRAYEAGQRARLKSRLIEAQKELRICSRDVCPELVHADCTGWLREIEAAMPSVVVSVRSASGDEVPNARVSIDGRPVKLRGTPTELSPGEHSVRVEGAGAPALVRRIVVNAGEKTRLVSVTLPSTKKAHTSSAPTSTPSWPYVVGAIGVVAVGAGVVLDVVGSRRLEDLRNDCAPSCSKSEVSSTRATIIVGDSLLAGGLVALGIAGYGLLSGGHSAETQSARR